MSTGKVYGFSFDRQVLRPLRSIKSVRRESALK
nr:MAG TPA: hypothetical protein [Caudoviricetes sp.]